MDRGRAQKHTYARITHHTHTQNLAHFKTSHNQAVVEHEKTRTGSNSRRLHTTIYAYVMLTQTTYMYIFPRLQPSRDQEIKTLQSKAEQAQSKAEQAQRQAEQAQAKAEQAQQQAQQQLDALRHENTSLKNRY